MRRASTATGTVCGRSPGRCGMTRPSQKGANVNLCAVTAPDTVRLVTFERGVEDFTLACGTGVGSTVFALTKRGLVSGRGVRVLTDGGTLPCRHRRRRPRPDRPAQRSFVGEFDDSLYLYKGGRASMSIQAVTHAVNVRREGRTVVILDQTLLPNRTEYLTLSEPGELWEAIHALRIRGAPAIGIFAAYSMAVLARRDRRARFRRLYREYRRLSDYLNSSRPTAVNLAHASAHGRRRAGAPGRARGAAGRARPRGGRDPSGGHGHVPRDFGIRPVAAARRGQRPDALQRRKPLATSRYGTAQGPFYLAQERGVRLHVWVDETRLLLQGARLTSYELTRAGVDCTLICDNMANLVMRQGRVQAVFFGCDRIARNGDVANKIGSSGLAVLAHHYGIPVYSLYRRPRSTSPALTATTFPLRSAARTRSRSCFMSSPWRCRRSGATTRAST